MVSEYLGDSLGRPPQEDIGASASHVGGHCHCPQTTRLSKRASERGGGRGREREGGVGGESDRERGGGVGERAGERGRGGTRMRDRTSGREGE